MSWYEDEEVFLYVTTDQRLTVWEIIWQYMFVNRGKKWVIADQPVSTINKHQMWSAFSTYSLNVFTSVSSQGGHEGFPETFRVFSWIICTAKGFEGLKLPKMDKTTWQSSFHSEPQWRWKFRLFIIWSILRDLKPFNLFEDPLKVQMIPLILLCYI